MENKGNILLIEDSADDEALTMRALRKANLANEIIVLRDGQAAVDYLCGESERPLPALVLLDIKLPKVGGLEVLARVRAQERTRLLPVVILTSSREEGDVLAGYTNGANAYVVKPVDFRGFAEAVARIGMFWVLLNEAPPRR
jgi:two-component system, response regulator